MLKTIIVEDVPKELDTLKGFLATYCPEVLVVAETGVLTEAIALIIKHKPTLLMMDVEIMGGTCYDILSELQKQGHPLDFELIFLTGNHKFDYATSAFAYSAIDFLTKPLDPVLLQKAVKKAVEHHEPSIKIQQLELLLDLLRLPEGNSQRMAVYLVGGAIEMVEINQIIYLEADGVITKFHLQNENILTSARNLGYYTQFLQRDARFFSISNSLFINLNHMQRYNHAEKLVMMQNETNLYASRRGGQDLRNYLTTNAIPPKSAMTGIMTYLKNLWGN